MQKSVLQRNLEWADRACVAFVPGKSLDGVIGTVYIAISYPPECVPPFRIASSTLRRDYNLIEQSRLPVFSICCAPNDPRAGPARASHITTEFNPIRRRVRGGGRRQTKPFLLGRIDDNDVSRG